MLRFGLSVFQLKYKFLLYHETGRAVYHNCEARYHRYNECSGNLVICNSTSWDICAKRDKISRCLTSSSKYQHKERQADSSLATGMTISRRQTAGHTMMTYVHAPLHRQHSPLASISRYAWPYPRREQRRDVISGSPSFSRYSFFTHQPTSRWTHTRVNQLAPGHVNIVLHTLRMIHER